MKKIIIFLIIIIFFCLGITIQYININKYRNDNVSVETNENIQTNKNKEELERKIDDFGLILVNFENELPEDYNIELADIDETRQFDARAIEYLNNMLTDIKNDGILNIWIQSAYRSIEYQRKLFNDSINEYMIKGSTREEAEEITLQTINKPGTSEHNLGLAVDFNYVDYDFEKTKVFEWLNKNAENYGFILRYKKEKEDITKVDYEPWHWRYVGIDNAKRINGLNMCLEEYVEYLKTI